MSRCLFSFVTQACPSRPFYALRATTRTALNFGGSVGWSQGSHTNVTLPLQFRHPGPPFSTLLHPADHPQNSFKFWLVGWLVGRSVGHGEVTQMSRCHFSFMTRARPSRPFYALQATPKTSFNFGRSVGRLVGWSVGRSVGWSVGHREVTRMSRCLFSFITRACPSRPFYALQATPKTALYFGWLVGRSAGRSQGSHTNVTLPLQFRDPGPPFPTLLCSAGHSENSLQFWSSVGQSVGQSVGWSVGRLVDRSQGNHRNHINVLYHPPKIEWTIR
jgi:hypothetical protein